MTVEHEHRRVCSSWDAHVSLDAEQLMAFRESVGAATGGGRYLLLCCDARSRLVVEFEGRVWRSEP